MDDVSNNASLNVNRDRPPSSNNENIRSQIKIPKARVAQPILPSTKRRPTKTEGIVSIPVSPGINEVKKEVEKQLENTPPPVVNPPLINRDNVLHPSERPPPPKDETEIIVDGKVLNPDHIPPIVGDDIIRPASPVDDIFDTQQSIPEEIPKTTPPQPIREVIVETTKNITPAPPEIKNISRRSKPTLPAFFQPKPISPIVKPDLISFTEVKTPVVMPTVEKASLLDVPNTPAPQTVPSTPRPPNSPPRQTSAPSLTPKQNELDTKLAIPNYALMNNEQKAHFRAMFVAKFNILREAWPNQRFPEITPEMPLEEVHAQYDVFVKQIYVNQGADGYKVYLVILWLAIEAFLCKILKLNAGGYTVYQMNSMNKYQKLLIELGENDLKATGGVIAQSTWPVELRIFGLALINALFFIAIKWLSGFIGENMANNIMNTLSSYLSGGNGMQMAQEMLNNAPVPGGVPTPANNGAPFDIMSLVSNLGQMFFNGNNNRNTNTNNPTNANTNTNTSGNRFRPAYEE